MSTTDRNPAHHHPTCSDPACPGCTPTAIRDMLNAAREEARSVISRMKLPTEAVNDVQRALKARSGTPREFADGLVDTIGEISLQEAQQAIRRYEDEWNRAGEQPKRRSTDHAGAGL